MGDDGWSLCDEISTRTPSTTAIKRHTPITYTQHHGAGEKGSRFSNKTLRVHIPTVQQ